MRFPPEALVFENESYGEYVAIGALVEFIEDHSPKYIKGFIHGYHAGFVIHDGYKAAAVHEDGWRAASLPWDGVRPLTRAARELKRALWTNRLGVDDDEGKAGDQGE